MTRTTSYLQALATGLICLSFLAFTDLANAQRGGGFGRDSGMQMLGSEKVQEELELVPDQVEQIDEVQNQQREAMREMFMGMRDRFRNMDRDGREAAMQEVREKMTELNEKFMGQANEVLLPHQVDRWKQLKFQMQAQQAGGADRFLASDGIAKQLNITEEQMQALKDKAVEVRQSMQEKIEKIRNEARNEVLSVLTPEQQEQYKALIGNSFAFEEQRRDRGGRDGGGRGDRGGRDGGGRGDRGGRDGGGRGDRGGRDGGGGDKADDVEE